MYFYLCDVIADACRCPQGRIQGPQKYRHIRYTRRKIYIHPVTAGDVPRMSPDIYSLLLHQCRPVIAETNSLSERNFEGPSPVTLCRSLQFYLQYYSELLGEYSLPMLGTCSYCNNTSLSPWAGKNTPASSGRFLTSTSPTTSRRRYSKRPRGAALPPPTSVVVHNRQGTFRAHPRVSMDPCATSRL